MSDAPSTRHLALARKAVNGFGFAGDPVVVRYWDDQRVGAIDILSVRGKPAAGITSYSTIGLSDHAVVKDGKPFPLRFEFLGACGADYPDFANALSTAAFCVINSKWFCAPGMIFPDILEMHRLSSTLSDLYFVPPFLWNGSFDSELIEGIKTAWLLAVPISKAETEFARKYGPAELEKKLEESRIDMFDLQRLSVI
ncbi:suppressor of fused domain protein [Ramlibacter pallidus]|uniref:Suppressor of fused domain protein n=1 Tax=Ramlibacter pallidus TaxID=2780087 RepID=A0ABR9S1L2_9BURK|nr:suppressor of fused domain protein [Ramlibacter pallidus]MBE7367177.1 suppressor of fused domain protein [Ramlibacter pallidus]